jgi:opacity protein-like surface antigen
MKKAMQAAGILFAAMGLLAAAPAQAQVYWRVDAGWSSPRDTDFKDNDFNNAGNICAEATCTEGGTARNMDGSSILGAGVGYRFNSAVRGDVTLAYRGFYSLDEFVGDALYYADVKSTTLMVNAYYDFAAGGIRPYLGAGIGWARNKTDKLIQNFRLGFFNTFSGATREDAAVALMVGVTIPYSGRTLDLGYRYIDMGKFATGTTAAFGITSGHTGKLTAHELTVGLRF